MCSTQLHQFWGEFPQLQFSEKTVATDEVVHEVYETMQIVGVLGSSKEWLSMKIMWVLRQCLQ